jgi:hypothetical protein
MELTRGADGVACYGTRHAVKSADLEKSPSDGARDFEVNRNIRCGRRTIRLARNYLSRLPYGVVLISALANGLVSDEEIRLPLTLAYLLSAHISFRLLMDAANLARVERVFDRIIPNCLQASKGVLYVTHVPDELPGFLRSSTLILTDEQGFRLTSGLEVPQAVITRSEEERCIVRVHGAKRLGDSDLKAKLAVCAQLLNVQSPDSVDRGFWLTA